MPKALVEVGGAPMVLRALRGLDAAGITHIAVTAPTDALVDFEQLIGSALPDLSATVRVVAGERRVRRLWPQVCDPLNSSVLTRAHLS